MDHLGSGQVENLCVRNIALEQTVTKFLGCTKRNRFLCTVRAIPKQVKAKVTQSQFNYHRRVLLPDASRNTSCSEGSVGGGDEGTNGGDG